MERLSVSEKIVIGLILTGVLSTLISVTGLVMNTNRLIKEGYTQKNITYCQTYDTKTIWLKE